MREKAVRFGGGNGLVGVLTEPTPVRSLDDRPAVVLLNSGILHRVGACRIHVRIARALAERGYASLRFDFSGIGDSETRKDSMRFEQSAPLEVVDAMNHLTKLKGSERFILGGLCSGADMALTLAPSDPRVAGLVLLDPWAYKTPKQKYVHYWKRAQTWEAWHNQLKRRLPMVFGGLRKLPVLTDLTDDFEMPTYVRELPPRESVAAMFRTLLSRDTELFMVYTGGQEDYNYRSQFLDGFSELDFRSLLQLHFLQDADHIFTGLQHQAFLTKTIGEWMAKRWPVRAAAGSVPPLTPAAAGLPVDAS